MSGNSSVGTSGVYEAGDQRNVKNSETQTANRYDEGTANSRLANDSKDERSLANRLAAAEGRGQKQVSELHKKDPTLPAVMHGNEPSKGARIDAELQAEEEEMLQKKGHQNMPAKKM